MMFGFGGDIWLMWLLSIGITLAIPVAIVWLIVMLVRRSNAETARPHYDPAAEQLRYRYARGEISEPEFERGMHLLGYDRAP